ncbi:MAG: TonB-dependent receptor [Pyrinomonadaceae bacterium]|nr:TonB-dependent receptor [Pyrinomonadaceae bacterium]
MFNRSSIFSAFALGFITLFFSTNLFAQGTTGSIEGTVNDASGAVVPGASIKIVSASNTSGFSKMITTSEYGRFILPAIPAGTYELRVSSLGFITGIFKVDVYSDSRTQMAIVLEIPTFGHPKSYSKDSFTGPSPDLRYAFLHPRIQKLPVGTTFPSLLTFIPNVRSEPLVGGFQIDGGSGSDNTFFIDGQEVTNFRSGELDANNELPFELIREAQVNAAGINAEFSGALGGVINVVTKGGNDNWRGNFGFSLSPAKLQGRPNLILSRFGSGAGQIEFFQPNKDDSTAYFPSATLSGPILKEKFWFFGSYSPQIYSNKRTIGYFSSSDPTNRTVTESVEYKAKVRTDFAYFRLDAQPVKRLRMMGTFLYNPIDQDGILPSAAEGLGGVPQSFGGLRGAALLATRGGRQNANTVNGQVSIDATKNFLINFRAGRSFLNEKLNSYGLPRTTRYICSTSGSPANVPGSNCSRGFQNTSNNFVRDREVSKRTTFGADASLYGIELGGRHIFKFGYQYNHISNDIAEGYVEAGIVNLFYNIPISTLIGLTPTPGNLGSGFLQRFGSVGESSNRNQALFAQDSWNIGRLSLNLGIRFENENTPDYGKDDGFKFGWGYKIAPRVGAAVDVLGNGKTKLFGNFGWHFDRLKFEAFQGNLSQFFYRDYFEILPSRGASYTNYTPERILGGNIDKPFGECPIINSMGWSVCQLNFFIPSQIIIPTFDPTLFDPEIKPTRTEEFTVGFEQKLGNLSSLTGRYIRRNLKNPIEDIGFFNAQGSEQRLIGNPGQGVVCRVTRDAGYPCPKAERRYDALEVIVDKRHPRFFFNVNYTYSRLKGTYSGLTSSDELGRSAPNSTRYFDLPSSGFDANGNSDSGRLATDRPHVFKAFGGYVFDWADNLVNRTTVSAFTTVQSGTPLTTMYSLYGLQQSILFGRGDLGRTGTFSETDLMVSHQYNFGQDNRFSLEPFIVLHNLFDERNVLSRQTSISITDFRSTVLTQSGCTTCGSQPDVYNTIFNKDGIRQFVQNYLNARGVSSSGIRNDYNASNLFQTGRSVRLGVKFSF